MVVKGHVVKGRVVLDEAVALPEGAEVRVELLEPSKRPTLADRFRDVIGKAQGLPSDLAENHDHYLHGVPKK